MEVCAAEVEELINQYFERIDSRIRVRVSEFDKNLQRVTFTDGHNKHEVFLINTEVEGSLYYLYTLNYMVRKASVDLNRLFPI